MATLTVNGSTTYQTMNGVGSNVNAWSWKNGELTHALDLLVDTLGHNIFRVVHDRMEWAGTGSTRPATTLSNLYALNASTLQSVYEVSDMQDLWNTIGYLNGKGVTGGQIIVSLMGWTALWMGGSGVYQTPSYITNNAQTNQDIATMLASLVYYGHHRRDISGANANLSFTYLSPFNEPNNNGLEGPLIGTAQMNTILTNVANTLTAIGDSTTKLSVPDTATNEDSYTAVFNATVLGRCTDFAAHAYTDDPANAPSLGATRSGVKDDWLTETSIWATGLDNNGPLEGTTEWQFGSDIADLFMGCVGRLWSAILVWEGFDTFYYHHDSYSSWGHVACTQGGSGCTLSDATTRIYAPRRRSWPMACLAKAARPGMVSIGLSGITGCAFYHPTTHLLTIVGHNTGGSSLALNGTLQNVGTIPSLALYQTNSTTDLAKTGDVVVSGGTFSTSVGANSFFYFTSSGGTPPTGTPVLSVR